jgi:hypothetical protein
LAKLHLKRVARREEKERKEEMTKYVFNSTKGINMVRLQLNCYNHYQNAV